MTNEMPKTGDDSTCVAMLMMFDDKLCTNKGEIMFDADENGWCQEARRLRTSAREYMLCSNQI